MATTNKLILDHIFENEASKADSIYLTQPIGGGQVADYTWRQTMDQARRMAAHIKSQNFEPGARIALLSKNSAHFIMAELAIWMAGCTTVAIFPTETADTVKYVLEHSGASMLFVGKLDIWDQQKGGVPANLPCVALPLSPKTSYESWDSVIKRTQPLAGKVKRNPADIAILLYTSGSTGTPKGVMHSFERVSRVGEGMLAELKKYIGSETDIRVLSYLPLAHVFERAWVECTTLIAGTAHVYFAESLDTFVADLIPILGGIVKKKILKGLGLDKVLLAGSGSAPIPPELISWYRRLGLNLMEGYGMSEDMAFSHMSTAAVNAPGCVGVPMPGVLVKISEEGEIQIKSPGQLVGYYKRPDLDAESFTADGYFKTGDRGERRADGLLKITGRVKEIFKSSKGEYVSPAPIENRIQANPMVESCMVSGAGQAAAYAMVVLNETLRPKQNDPAVRAEVEAELGKLLGEVNSHLVGHEKLQFLVIAKEPWTIENGSLTPTMKIKRSRIESDVSPKVETWYAGKGKIQWA